MNILLIPHLRIELLCSFNAQPSLFFFLSWRFAYNRLNCGIQSLNVTFRHNYPRFFCQRFWAAIVYLLINSCKAMNFNP